VMGARMLSLKSRVAIGVNVWFNILNVYPSKDHCSYYSTAHLPEKWMKRPFLSSVSDKLKVSSRFWVYHHSAFHLSVSNAERTSCETGVDTSLCVCEKGTSSRENIMPVKQSIPSCRKWNVINLCEAAAIIAGRSSSSTQSCETSSRPKRQC
jgi:hypothetical protein